MSESAGPLKGCRVGILRYRDGVDAQDGAAVGPIIGID